MSRAPKHPFCDKMRCGTSGAPDGAVYEVFDPPWWAIGRWLGWLVKHVILSRGTFGTITVIWQNRMYEVRARLVQHPKKKPAKPSPTFWLN